ncbi:hypothetical protein ACHAQH_001162 [Verticillium albo-atrum]
MFELPEAKRVRREDLVDSASDASSANEDDQHHAALRARLESQLASAFTFAPVDPPPAARKLPVATKETPESETQPGQQQPPEGDDEQEFEFRLFSSTKPAAKVILPDDDEGAPRGEGAMLRRRPLRYYLAEALTDAQRAEVEFAAVSAEDVFKRAARRCWGMEMPWRVTHIEAKATAAKRTTASLTTGLREDGKRKRPGQKKRLAMRMKEREAKKKAEEAENLKASKEEQLKEKKKRLNRQRKLKRRAKAKEERAAAGLPSDNEGSSSSENDD